MIYIKHFRGAPNAYVVTSPDLIGAKILMVTRQTEVYHQWPSAFTLGTELKFHFEPLYGKVRFGVPFFNAGILQRENISVVYKY